MTPRFKKWLRTSRWNCFSEAQMGVLCINNKTDTVNITEAPLFSESCLSDLFSLETLVFQITPCSLCTLCDASISGTLFPCFPTSRPCRVFPHSLFWPDEFELQQKKNDSIFCFSSVIVRRCTCILSEGSKLRGFCPCCGCCFL